MSITDELRDWISTVTWLDDGRTHTREKIQDIADHIDVTHRSALEKLAVQLDETSDMREFCGRLEEAATNREDVTLWGVDYTPLPLDADGVSIHIGDRVENNERVERIVLTDGSWEPSVYIGKLPNVLHEQFCHEISHYQAPTVEDVLREFASCVLNSGHQWGLDACDTIAEYAARLRLAGDE